MIGSASGSAGLQARGGAGADGRRGHDWPGHVQPVRSSNPFVGRRSEMALLEDSLVRARGGSPQIVAIEGVAGIGKTSLVRHFVAQEDPSTVFWCSGDLDEVGLPWGLLTQLAEAAQAKGAPGLADLVKELSPDTDPLLVGANLVRLVKEDQLAVVVLDDIQWADQQSLAAARFAFRRLTPGQVQVVMTYRPEEAARMGEGWRRLLVEKGSRVRLAGLNVPELVELSEAVTGSRLSRRAAAKLFEQTSGHPLYARSLLEQLPETIFERADGPCPHRSTSPAPFRPGWPRAVAPPSTSSGSHPSSVRLAAS